MTRTDLFRFLPLSILLMSFSVAHAQVTQSGLAPTLPSASAASYYYIAKPGELTMQVNIWGFVQKPGRYEVPSSTDLVQLISFAGGPQQYAKLDEVRIIRLTREDSTINRKELTVNLESLEGLTDGMLALSPGDTIFVDHTTWVTIRDLFNAITTTAILTSAIAQLIIALIR